jgi:hypothetical protein
VKQRMKQSAGVKQRDETALVQGSARQCKAVQGSARQCKEEKEHRVNRMK